MQRDVIEFDKEKVCPVNDSLRPGGEVFLKICTWKE